MKCISRIAALCLFIFFGFHRLFAFSIEKSEPPSWFSGMAHDTISVLVYGESLQELQSVSSTPEIEILLYKTYANNQFLKLGIRIIRAGDAWITFRGEGHREEKLHFPILERTGYQAPSFNSADIIYLLMPDRFADGNPNNNTIPGHLDNAEPEHKWGRHGGDLRGIINNISYLKELGISALWITPVFENNYPHAYHGYTPTDLYAIEPHLGSEKDYHELIDSLHQNGIKIIKDHIVNHIS
ncbi:MAG TPA: alpha-amlyase, partial [Candidatus Marinimicrobia bacterium]|nr:alpha-amlyase [Candidatus Neomarinimicrobiota bacterium]